MFQGRFVMVLAQGLSGLHETVPVICRRGLVLDFS